MNNKKKQKVQDKNIKEEKTHKHGNKTHLIFF